MSRAFVKEPEGDQAGDDSPERPQSEHPNYITVAGLERMKARVEELRGRARLLEDTKDDLAVKTELKSLNSELRYLDKRVQVAIPVDPAAQAGAQVRFGATVEVADADGQHHRFTIVGEDEADSEMGSISWVSPLARALLNRQAGDTVTWQRPAGNLELEIESVEYHPGG